MIKKAACIAVLLVLLFSFTACGWSHGIPDGTYHKVSSVNDKAVHQGLEYAWQIDNGEAEHLYSTYTITEENGKIYFYNRHNDEKLEVSYDSATKVFTVYTMTESGTEAQLFKKAGLVF